MDGSSRMMVYISACILGFHTFDALTQTLVAQCWLVSCTQHMRPAQRATAAATSSPCQPTHNRHPASYKTQRQQQRISIARSTGMSSQPDARGEPAGSPAPLERLTDIRWPGRSIGWGLH